MINKFNHITSLFGEHRLLDLEELALLLGRRPETIRKDMLRRPDAVPPAATTSRHPVAALAPCRRVRLDVYACRTG
ncbi:hypothetical protein LP414_09320 [Polaromonas sp. P1(28)-13]|nr:hypothetical protein LP414_09320 [Polaromonas sp. P1(28)-13]